MLIAFWAMHSVVFGQDLVKENLLFDDLPALGSSDVQVRDVFKMTFYNKNNMHVLPDGIALNNEGRFDYYDPPITQENGWFSYKKVAALVFAPTQTTEKEVVLAEKTLTNNTGAPSTTVATFSHVLYDTVTISTNISPKLAFSTKLPGVKKFDIAGEVSLSTVIGSSNTNVKNREILKSESVTIPAQSQITVQLVGTRATENADFSAPVTVDGSFGANFSQPVANHQNSTAAARTYFWQLPAQHVLPRTSGTLTGTVKSVVIYETKIVVK